MAVIVVVHVLSAPCDARAEEEVGLTLIVHPSVGRSGNQIRAIHCVDATEAFVADEDAFPLACVRLARVGLGESGVVSGRSRGDGSWSVTLPRRDGWWVRVEMLYGVQTHLVRVWPSERERVLQVGVPKSPNGAYLPSRALRVDELALVVTQQQTDSPEHYVVSVAKAEGSPARATLEGLSPGTARAWLCPAHGRPQELGSWELAPGRDVRVYASAVPMAWERERRTPRLVHGDGRPLPRGARWCIGYDAPCDVPRDVPSDGRIRVPDGVGAYVDGSGPLSSVFLDVPGYEPTSVDCDPSADAPSADQLVTLTPGREVAGSVPALRGLRAPLRWLRATDPGERHRRADGGFDARASRWVHVEEDGSFRTWLAPGAWRLEVPWRTSTGVDLEVLAGQAQQVVVQAPPRPRVRGRVTYDRRAASGPRPATVFACIHGRVHDRVTCDPDGSFEVEGPLPGEGGAYVVASVPGCVITKQAVLGDHDPVSEVHLELERGGAVEVTARTRDGRPLPGLELIDALHPTEQLTRRIVTDARGHARIDGLAPGPTRLGLQRPGVLMPDVVHVEQVDVDTRKPGRREIALVAPWQPIRVDLEGRWTSEELAGVAFSAAPGAPAPNRRDPLAELSEMVGGVRRPSVAMIEAPSTLWVHPLRDPVAVRVWAQRGQDVRCSEPLVLGSDRGVSTAPVTLQTFEPTGIDTIVRVVGPDGRPLIPTEGWLAWGGSARGWWTDVHLYEVTATEPLGTALVLSREVLSLRGSLASGGPPEEIEDAKLLLTSFRDVEGRWVDLSPCWLDVPVRETVRLERAPGILVTLMRRGSPASDVGVAFVPVLPGEEPDVHGPFGPARILMKARSDERGRVQLPARPSGLACAVVVDRREGWQQARELVVAPGDPIVHHLEVFSTTSKTLTLVDAHGEPLAGIHVEAIDLGGRPPAEANFESDTGAVSSGTTDGTGRVTLRGLVPERPYWLMILHDGFSDPALEQWKPADVTLRAKPR